MTISEFRATLEVRFQHWDRDRNGYLERSDMEEAARRLGAAFGRAYDSPEQLALLTSCRQLWHILARHADLDLDGRISRDEYAAAFSSEVMADPETFERIYRPVLVNVVRLADVDGDGRLNEEEYLRLMRAWYNAHESDAAEAFRLLDTDGDGFLALDELVRSATDHLLADDAAVRTPPAGR